MSISCPIGDWATEGIATGPTPGATTTTTTTQPPIPTPGGFLGAGEDWNVETQPATKDWAEDNAGDWGGDAQVGVAGKW